MKRRDLLQLASVSVLGLLLPSWLFPKPPKRLVVPGLRLDWAARQRRIADIYGRELHSPEWYGHKMVTSGWDHRGRRKDFRIRTFEEGDYPRLDLITLKGEGDMEWIEQRAAVLPDPDDEVSGMHLLFAEKQKERPRPRPRWVLGPNGDLTEVIGMRSI